MRKFVVRAVNTGFKFDLKAPNGQIIGTSEVYRSKAACLRGVVSVGKNAPAAGTDDLTAAGCVPGPHPKFELYLDRGGQYRFRLKAHNGKIILVSEGYITRSACLHGLESVRRNAPCAIVEEV